MTTKIAILGDPHFGHSANCGHINPETGLHTRLEDFCATFDQVLDYCEENRPRHLIILGDIYRHNHPTMIQQREFAKKLRRLQDMEQETLIIKGNHDITVSASSAHSTAPFQELGMSYITIVSEPSIYWSEHPTERGRPHFLAITCMPYLHKARLGLRDNKELLKAYKKKVKELLVQGGEHQIFIGHQTPEGAIPPQHQVELSTTGEFVVPTAILKEFDAAFFGHIHKIQKLNDAPPIWVCGSMDRIDFAEANEDKKLFIYDVESKEVTTHPLRVRDFAAIKIDVRDVEPTAISSTILETIEKRKVKDAVTKLTIEINEADKGFINYKEIEIALKDAHHVLNPDIKVQKTVRSRNKKVNEKLDSIDALKEYLDSKNE